MANGREAELKRVKADSKKEKSPPKDPSMTGGERAETPEQKAERARKKRQPVEAPIIQKDVT